MRLFVGIGLSDETQQAIATRTRELREAFHRLRWSQPEHWHVTLQFLGETDEATYSCVVEQLRKVRAQVVDVQLSEPGFFERAGVFYIAVGVTSSLVALHDEIEQALLPCGFEPEERAFAPHITLARRKGRGPSPDFTRLQRAVRLTPVLKLPSFQAKEFLLYQSFTGPAGSRYEVRERFSLM
ncbi:RNA 2',3'-cyclic phosphodiesterase [Alloacidobacterium sp.]|uniref:RNA 2',3'-cyclic phosphodiesterase n=1 Tax=Alloacidobacterium sp. TaxID=2951999 RepID=UPI002D4F5166|nr:RNA 2',3'-cyclic phosphodiesterase [Alloacidobacterium sp.]HYK37253.1 RNA 2',3'-cyclic phosphodiesterase [Alloacidobacterium sp.]